MSAEQHRAYIRRYREAREMGLPQVDAREDAEAEAARVGRIEAAAAARRRAEARQGVR